MKTRTVYDAFDNTVFNSQEECRAYEAQHGEMRLVGLNIDQVRAAISREDVELADAFEEIGSRIARTRRDAGDLRRGKKAVEAPREVEGEPQPAAASKLDESLKLDGALKRAYAAGRAAWVEGKGAVVPEAFAGVKPLYDAWLAGWGEGQTERGQGAAVEPELAEVEA